MNAKIIKPPTPLPDEIDLFLAGSIEMGDAPDWQAAITEALEDLPIIIANPRRDDWDSSQEQSILNPYFRAQVEWELDAQERAYKIGLYLAPGMKSPIALLELGLFAQTGKLLVCCPEGFWRRGNVEIVAVRYDLPLFESLDIFARGLRVLVGLDNAMRQEAPR